LIGIIIGAVICWRAGPKRSNKNGGPEKPARHFFTVVMVSPVAGNATYADFLQKPLGRNHAVGLVLTGSA
jgi:hypothetical protein